MTDDPVVPVCINPEAIGDPSQTPIVELRPVADPSDVANCYPPDEQDIPDDSAWRGPNGKLGGVMLDVEAWRAILSIAWRPPGGPTHASRFVVFRPRDLVATNGHVMLQLPLPHVPTRKWRLDADQVLPWLGGLPCRAALEIYRIGDWVKLHMPPRATVELAFRNPQLDDRSGLKGSAFDTILASINATAVPTDVHVNPEYLALMARLQKELGNRTGVTMCSFGNLPDQPGSVAGVAFSFATTHGVARFVVMRLAVNK